ncbi:MAG: hypothetical protein PHQ27_09595, partial [Victivallales bacterium]|nr:hypothetical protein [Victivallales bacterium]
MKMPIIFIHRGYASYMEFTLRQAVDFNPGHPIVLLGDRANDRFDFIQHYDLDSCSAAARDFAAIYRHHSTNSYHYELFCLQRWFILRDFMRQQQLECCFVGDTDVLYYDDFEYVRRAAGSDCHCGMLIYPERHAASAGVSFWTMPELEAFCNYCHEVYAHPDGLPRLLSRRGGDPNAGISDMDLARGYLDEYGATGVLNLADIIADRAIDVNFNTPHGGFDHEYQLTWLHRHKLITWQDRTPYCYNTRLNRNIRFSALHFQGPAKYAIGAYFRGRDFPGRKKLRLRFFFLNLAAAVYA